jgi:RNA polymerase sigma-70 factor (ECF subfamily)
MSHTTQPSLLSRLRNVGDQTAWCEFDTRYRSLILRYCRRLGLDLNDAEDVRQTVMMRLASSLEGFQYRPEIGRFRDYLGQAVKNAILRHLSRPSGAPSLLPNENLEALARHSARLDERGWEEEWTKFHLQQAMARIRETFEPRSVEIFQHLLKGASAAELAASFQTSFQAIHKIKQRIRRRLQQLIAEQIREEEFPEHHDEEHR